MTLLSRIATARTFFANFSVPCLYIAAAAFLAGSSIGAWGSYKVTRAVFERATLRAQKDLSDFTGQLAQNAAAGQAEARRLQAEANDAENQRQSAIMSALSQGFAGVMGQVRRDNLTLRESIRAPEYDCMRQPLPAGYIGVLQRPGGRVEPSRGNPGPGAPAAP